MSWVGHHAKQKLGTLYHLTHYSSLYTGVQTQNAIRMSLKHLNNKANMLYEKKNSGGRICLTVDLYCVYMSVCLYITFCVHAGKL